MEVFCASLPDVPEPTADRASALANIRPGWINVVDVNDFLDYLAGPIFEKVDDYQYPKGMMVYTAAYCAQSNFYRRLAQRIIGLL